MNNQKNAPKIPQGEWFVETINNEEDETIEQAYVHIDSVNGSLHEVCTTSPELAQYIVEAVNFYQQNRKGGP